MQPILNQFTVLCIVYLVGTLQGRTILYTRPPKQDRKIKNCKDAPQSHSPRSREWTTDQRGYTRVWIYCVYSKYMHYSGFAYMFEVKVFTDKCYTNKWTHSTFVCALQDNSSICPYMWTHSVNHLCTCDCVVIPHVRGDALLSSLIHLCWSINHFPSITAWEHVFVPREYLVPHLEELFIRYIPTYRQDWNNVRQPEMVWSDMSGQTQVFSRHVYDLIYSWYGVVKAQPQMI